MRDLSRGGGFVTDPCTEQMLEGVQWFIELHQCLLLLIGRILPVLQNFRFGWWKGQLVLGNWTEASVYSPGRFK